MAKTPDLQPIGNSLAAQHNSFIRTPLRMGIIESRIFIQALSDINHETTEFPVSIIPMDSIMRSKRNGEAYADVRKAVDTLVTRAINLLSGTERRERVHKIPLMAEVEIVRGQGAVRVCFNERAKPYLLQLKESGNFTQADIATLLTFKNPNSARLYWILKSYAGLGRGSLVTQAVTLETLKLWLLEDSTAYPVYADFVIRVIEPVFKEFAAVGYNASWVPVRTGKKTTALQFTIPKDKPKTLRAAATPEEATSWSKWLAAADPKLQAAYAGLLDKNQLTITTAKKIIRWVAANPDRAVDFYKARHRIATHKQPIANMRSFALAALNANLGTAFK